jgi:hypothetical protein
LTVYLQKKAATVLRALIAAPGPLNLAQEFFAHTSDPAYSARVMVSHLRRTVGLDLHVVGDRGAGTARYYLSKADGERLVALGLIDAMQVAR